MVTRLRQLRILPIRAGFDPMGVVSVLGVPGATEAIPKAATLHSQ
jgi:hypothetical protein